MWFIVFFLSLLRTALASDCSMVDWSTSFDSSGYSICAGSIQSIRGLWRSSVTDWNDDPIDNIDHAQCCLPPTVFRPLGWICQIADWDHSMASAGWSLCPAGHFLNGLKRGMWGWLMNINFARCCKPADHPYYYGHCYDKDVSTSFDQRGLSACATGYFMVGMSRTTGTGELHDLEKFRCCRMVKAPLPLTSLAEVKTRVMDRTLRFLATLAFFQGFGSAAGCHARYVGDGFVRTGDSLEASDNGCSSNRLKIKYGNWRLVLSNITYGTPVVQAMKPTVYLSGQVTNDDTSPTTVTVQRTVQSTRTVTHTKTSSWTTSTELGISIGYEPADASIDYTFSYETSTTTEDSDSKEDIRSFQISSQKTLPAKSAANWEIILTKQRVTVPYTATVTVEFSTEISGYLRSGRNNYHKDHRGNWFNTDFSYQLGDDKISMIKDLKEKSSKNMSPWLWYLMQQEHSDLQWNIDWITYPDFYNFPLTGQFEDVLGIRADIKWSTASTGVAQSLLHPPEPAEEDPPRVFPPPPTVDLSPRPHSVAEQMVTDEDEE